MGTSRRKADLGRLWPAPQAGGLPFGSSPWRQVSSVRTEDVLSISGGKGLDYFLSDSPSEAARLNLSLDRWRR